MRIAVFANMKAGGGKAAAVVRKLSKAWSGHELYGAFGFGGEVLSRSIIPEAAEGYVPKLNAAVRALLRTEPRLLVAVGGDGAAAYAAECLIREGSEVPILGIGAGTANVGPIVSCTADALPDPEKLKRVWLGAVEASADGRHIAYGFNDIVIGNTFLGTSPEGETKTYEARALAAQGNLTEAAPLRDIFAEGQAGMSLNGQPLKPKPQPVAQLVASPMGADRFYGRAVTGLLCYTPDSPFRAAAYISPEPIVSMEESEAGFTSWRVGGQLLMEEGTELEIKGLKEEVCAVADGNPYLLPSGSVTLHYKPDVIRVMKEKQS